MAYTDIDDPSAYFQTTLYTGTGSDQNITNTGNSDLQPDWTWIKKRNGSTNNMVTDSVRGATKNLVTNTSAVEDTDANGLKAFLSDGFTVGSTGAFNSSNNTFVSWNWKAGTSFSNSAGANGASIASTGSINTAAGFSIVKYEATGSNATVGHGLGAVPKMIIVKDLEDTGGSNWAVYHSSLGNTKFLELNANAAPDTSSGLWNNTTPTSSVFTIGTNSRVNNSGNDFIAYCFADVQGFSKIGSYLGNGSADGAFIYTGFKPAFFMLKRTNTAGSDWSMWGYTSLSGFNSIGRRLFPNTNGAESSQDSSAMADFLSNGIKLRQTDGDYNGDDNTYIYMAFAENPFVSAAGTPVTAR